MRRYVEDVSSGNVTWRAFLSAIAVELDNKVQRHLRIGQPYPSIRGQARDVATRGALNLQPGELVQVRSKEEILATLGANQKHRGLSFDAEMLPFCGGTFRVLRRVERIIDEKTGRMIRMRNDCIVLDGVICSGQLSRNRLFLPARHPRHPARSLASPGGERRLTRPGGRGLPEPNREQVARSRICPRHDEPCAVTRWSWPCKMTK